MSGVGASCQYLFSANLVNCAKNKLQTFILHWRSQRSPLMTICLLIPPRALSTWSFKLMTQATEFVQQMKFIPGLLNIFVIC